MKNQKGITLITLVITAIVLIILAAISITAITDEDKGVVKKAKEATTKAEDTKDEEDKEIDDIIEYTNDEAFGTEVYTVIFSYKNSSGTVVTSETLVDDGCAVDTTEYPTVPEYEDTSYVYTFSKWTTTDGGTTTANLSNVGKDMTVYASYTKTSKFVCFVAGTKVLTENGLVNIEDVEVGMNVYSRNEKTGATELKEVTNIFVTEDAKKDMVKVTVNKKVIESTSRHEYYVVGKGWTYAFELEVGDSLLNSDGEEVIVENVEFNKFNGEFQIVYNFEVEDNHNYFVGEENVLVHNASSPSC